MNRRIWATFFGVCCSFGLASCISSDRSDHSEAPQMSAGLPQSATDETPTLNTSSPNLRADGSNAKGSVSALAQSSPVPSPVAQQTLSQATSGLKIDYSPTTPLPETGRVTIRDHIRNVDPSRLISDCPTDSAPYAFAESAHYRVQICSEEYDPWLPKYYIGQAKDGSGELRITNSNPTEARQLIFKTNGYTYILYRDAAQPEQENAYLQVFMPDGDGYAEALLYLYEAYEARNLSGQ